MIPPDQMFAVFEEGELDSMSLGSSVGSAKRFAESAAVFKKLDSYLDRDKSWASLIVDRLAEIVTRDYDKKYANPWENCFIAYLHLLERHDKDKAEEAAKVALSLPNSSYYVRGMIKSILGLEYLEMFLDVIVEVKSIHPEFVLPKAMTAGAAGYDLRYLDPESNSVTLQPGERRALPLGCQMAIPEGWMIEIVPRSGLAMKRGITLLNGPGIVDCDYRGEFHALMINESDKEAVIDHGERICQLLVRRVPRAVFKMVDNLSSTKRGEGGFGSTGR